MPHLQDDAAQDKFLKQTNVGSVNGRDPTSSLNEELPIQVATPNFLGASDPVVAMAKKVSIAIVDSSFESVEQSQCQNSVSPPPSRIVKSVITPSSSICNINSTASSNSHSADDVSTTDTQSIPSGKSNSGPIFTTVYSSSPLSHSSIGVKRRISQIEDEEHSAQLKLEQNCQRSSRESTFFKYGESPSASESSRPTMIHNISSLSAGNKTRDSDARRKELSKMKPKKVESGFKLNGAAGDSTISSTSTAGNTSTIEAVAAASTMAHMRNRTSLISPTTSGEKRDDASNATHYPPLVGHHPHHILHPNFHPGVVAPPAFHPHPLSFGSPPFIPGGYQMTYPGYPPHLPPGSVPLLMSAQFHGHPAAGFYASCPPGYHPNPAHQQNGQHLPPFVPPYGRVPGTALLAAKPFSNNSGTNTDDKDDENNQVTAMPSVNIRGYSASEHNTGNTTSSKSRGVGKPISANRCVPLHEPIPSKHWRKAETAEQIVLPDFHRLVNYPDYLSKSRSLVTVEKGASGGSKANEGKKHCVMCGKLRICSASSLIEKGRAAVSGEDGTAHIIPRQNKGLCTACDVTVWVLVTDGLEIKWCKGCKNFRPWAAFGEKGSATKCVRCRERQREKYAMQKNAKRARLAKKSRVIAKAQPRSISTSSSGLPSSSSEQIELVKGNGEIYFAAARGLTSLMNAAATL